MPHAHSSPSPLRPGLRLALALVATLALVSCARSDRETYFESRHRVLSSAPSAQLAVEPAPSRPARAAGVDPASLTPSP